MRGCDHRWIEVFCDARGEWRWRAIRAGRIVETGAEGYSRRSSAMRAVRAKLAAQYRVRPA